MSLHPVRTRTLTSVLGALALLASLFLGAAPAHAAGVTVSGTVTGSGSGLEGIDLTLINDATDERYEAISSADGAFEFSDVPNGDYLLRAFRSGEYLTTFYNGSPTRDGADYVTVDGGNVSGLNLAMLLGGSVFGTVTDTEGQPLEGMDVTVIVGDGAAAYGPTDADGKFSLTGVPAGDHEVDASDPSDSYLGSDRVPVTIVGGQASGPVNLTMTKANRIEGTLAGPSGSPVNGAVTVYQGDEWIEEFEVEEGSFSIGGLPDGSYTLLGTAHGLASQWFDGALTQEAAQVITVTGGQTVTNIDFRFTAGGSVTGRVVNSSGEPIRYAEVSLNGDLQGREGGTSADGTFTIGGLASGTYRGTIRVDDENYVGETRFTAEVTAPGVTTVGDITVATASAISGTVTTQGCSLGDGYRVEVWQGDARVAEESFEGTSFSIGGLAPGDYTVRVVADGDCALASQNVSTPLAGPLSFVLTAGGTISGHLTLLDAMSDPGTFYAINSDGVKRSVTYSDNGDYSVSGLSAGEWTLGLEYEGFDALYFNNKTSLSDATFVQVTVGETTTVPDWTISYPWATVGIPTISGTAAVGETLTANPGSWVPDYDPTFTYQWLADGSPIDGATSSTFVVAAGQAGSRLSVRVTAVDSWHPATAATSAETDIVPTPLPPLPKSSVPEISGSAKVGATLAVRTGNWGPAPVTLNYQWYRGEQAVDGATGATYQVTTADVGFKLRVAVTGAKSGYSSVTKYSDWTALVKQPK